MRGGDTTGAAGEVLAAVAGRYRPRALFQQWKGREAVNPLWFLLPVAAAVGALAVWCWARREQLPPGTCHVCRGRKWVMDRYAVGGPNDEPCPHCNGTGLEPDVAAELADLRRQLADKEAEVERLTDIIAEKNKGVLIFNE